MIRRQVEQGMQISAAEHCKRVRGAVCACPLDAHQRATSISLEELERAGWDGNPVLELTEVEP